MRVARLLIVFLAAAWIALIVAAPVSAFGVPLSGATYALGSLICHQRPERSFHLDGAQLPVCARCFGLYLGFALGTIAVPSGLTGITRSTLRTTIVLAAFPTALTWSFELLGLWASSNTTRFVAALPLGAAIALTVNYVECARPLRIGSRHPRTPI